MNSEQQVMKFNVGVRFSRERAQGAPDPGGLRHWPPGMAREPSGCPVVNAIGLNRYDHL